MSRRTWTTAALVAPLLALTGAPALAEGEATPPPPLAVADFCANVPSSFAPFTDTADNTFADNIRCLAAAEITQGGPSDLPEDAYGPGLPVRRDAMASFMARLLDTADALDTGSRIRPLPPYDGQVSFTDVDPASVHAQSVDRLAAAGVVAGGPGGRPADEYGPALEVSRAQMASFLRNALQFLTGEDVATDQDFFTDDETAVPHEPRINAVAALGIAVGDGQDSYDPARTVSRDQMAGFLTRTLAVLEQVGAIGPLPFTAPVDTAVTDAPDLVGAQVVAPGEQTSSVLFRFDEEVAADAVEAGAFAVYDASGERVAGQSATPDETDARLVRVELAVSEQRLATVTLAAVSAGAVEDADGSPNPIGAVPLGTGVQLEGGRTAAPDLVRLGEPTSGGTTTSVEFVFDQSAFLVDPAAGQFSIVRPDGSSVDGTPVEGDGTSTVRVEFEGEIPADQVARGVVLAGTVSNEEQVDNGLPVGGIGDTPEGDLNPLQVAGSRTTSLPDLVSAEPVLAPDSGAADAVELVFDEPVTAAEAARFHLYDRTGAQRDGTAVADGDTDGDERVVVEFEQGALEAAVGVSLDEGAVTETGGAARPNQEDELALPGSELPAGRTVGPDLVEVTRESTEEGVTLRFVFDDEAAEVTGELFAVGQSGEQTALADCAPAAGQDGQGVVECAAAAEDDPLTLLVDESAGFEQAQSAVVGAVGDGAVADAEGDTSPEGAALLADAQA